MAAPPEHQLSIPNAAGMDRELSTRSAAAEPKCFPVEFMLENGGAYTVPVAQPPIKVSLLRKVGTEFIGTFFLIFAATAASIANEKTGAVTLLGGAATSGLAIMIVIFATGHISGAHVNPAITIAFAALRHFPWIQVPFYIAAQVSGSIAASFALKGIFHPDLHGGVTTPHSSVWASFVIEFIISFQLMFVIISVATDTRAVGELAGIAIGGCVMMNILVASSVSGASMNPVRSLGPAIAANNFKSIWLYIVGPIVGMVSGASTYTILRGKEEGTSGPPLRVFRH